MTSLFGAFGKMPGLGDFFRLDLPNSFIEPWDSWLQELLLVGREALGARWQDCYMSAPIWRFVLSPGQMGPDAVMGIMMPSVDRVGRQFPLTLASVLPNAPEALNMHFGNAATFEALEGCALDALENDLSREALGPKLAEVALRPPASLRSSEVETGLLRVSGPDVWPGLTAALVAPGFRRPSVWSAADGEDTRVMVHEGLPRRALWSRFFDPADDRDSLDAVLA